MKHFLIAVGLILSVGAGLLSAESKEVLNIEIRETVKQFNKGR